MMCANAQRPMDPGKARRLPSRALPKYFAKSSRPQYCKPLQPPRLETTNYEPKASTKLNFPSIPTLLPRPQFFEMFFPQIQAGFCSAQDIFFASWIIKFLTPVPGRFHCPRGFRFLTLSRFFSSIPPGSFLKVKIQLFPFFPFNSFIDCLAESVPVRINQRRSPPLKLKMLCVNEDPLRTHLSSARNGNPSWSPLWKSLAKLRFFFFLTRSDLVPRRRSPTSTAL